jgi:hypothetical protein
MSLCWTVGIALWVTLGVAVGSWAQESPPPAGTEASPASPAEVKRRLRLLRAWEITRVLKLDGETAGKVLAAFARTDQRRQAILKQRSDARREMVRLTKKKDADAAAMQTVVDAFVKSTVDLMQLYNEEFQELKAVLSPLQQAKYLLAQRTFHSKIQQMLRRVQKK